MLLSLALPIFQSFFSFFSLIKYITYCMLKILSWTKGWRKREIETITIPLDFLSFFYKWRNWMRVSLTQWESDWLMVLWMCMSIGRKERERDRSVSIWEWGPFVLFGSVRVSGQDTTLVTKQMVQIWTKVLLSLSLCFLPHFSHYIYFLVLRGRREKSPNFTLSVTGITWDSES